MRVLVTSLVSRADVIVSQSHVTCRSVFQRVLVLFVVYMKDVLGDKLTADAEAGWKLVAKALTDTVAKRYEDMEKEKA